MARITAGPYEIDYAEAGSGPAVLLLHSSAAGNRQWRALMDARAGKNRMVAINLFGYGATTPWPNDRPLTLDDEATLVAAVAHFVPEPFTLVGHSLGGAVAAAAARRLGNRVEKLIVFEPILFYLLERHGEPEAFSEIDGIRRQFVALAEKGDWDAAARLFIDYWTGHGSWDAMNDERRVRILHILPPLVHEWEMIGPGAPPLEYWTAIEAPVHYLHAADTRLSSRALAAVMKKNIPRWHFETVESGGHIAPISRPDLVNPLIGRILDGA